MESERNGHTERKSSRLISDDFHRLHAAFRPLNFERRNFETTSQMRNKHYRNRLKKQSPEWNLVIRSLGCRAATANVWR